MINKMVCGPLVNFLLFFFAATKAAECVPRSCFGETEDGTACRPETRNSKIHSPTERNKDEVIHSESKTYCHWFLSEETG